MLAKIKQIYTTPYCASHMILLRYQIPFHSYEEHFQNIPETCKKNNGCAFLKTNKEDFERYGLEAGTVTTGRQITLDGLHNITG